MSRHSIVATNFLYLCKNSKCSLNAVQNYFYNLGFSEPIWTYITFLFFFFVFESESYVVYVIHLDMDYFSLILNFINACAKISNAHFIAIWVNWSLTSLNLVCLVISVQSVVPMYIWVLWNPYKLYNFMYNS